ISGHAFNKKLTRVCNALGINKRSMHKIRKTYGTTLIDNNVDDSVIAEMMGHTDITTTRKYYYYSNKAESTKVEQVTKALSGI
ncbi:MAG: tyrosine-type recombinase/integrase, partial [Eubacteriales bacterium]|nr:tyrosine-type recombinase/integrase [Eubacteriales bacterium]